MSNVEHPPLGGPASARQRILALDVVRGVALLGILLLNILAFGLPEAGYFNPLIGTDPGQRDHGLNLVVWGAVDLGAEGAMRALFSMLFGASVVLFATSEHSMSGRVYLRRHLGLFAFGVFDSLVLLWSGDILITYALCGLLLYPLRLAQPRTLVMLGMALWLLLTLAGSVIGAELRSDQAASTGPAVERWDDFKRDVAPTQAQQQAELAIRLGPYGPHFRWNAEAVLQSVLYGLPAFLLWDALLMMLLGMVLMRLGVLTGTRSRGFYARLFSAGVAIGLLINGLELAARIRSNLDPILLFGFFQPTYHLGRGAVALAWLGGILWLCRRRQQAPLLPTSDVPRVLSPWSTRFASVGRMALSNYLLQSFLGLVLFTGTGLGLLGSLNRWQLYVLVVLIWTGQMALSTWWLRRYNQGPAEWLWRLWTYQQASQLHR